MIRIVFTFCIATLLSCSTKEQNRNRNIEIIIQDAASYKYNLKKEVATVFFQSRTPSEIKFQLTDEERNNIIESYYSLGIADLEDSTNIQDRCLDMPTFNTIIYINSTSRNQRLIIEQDCNKISMSDILKARRIKKFLKIVYKILGSKPELKTLPNSDIIYI